VQARLTDEQWQELITPDTPLHQRWEKYMDTAAGFLKQLQDAHIPVLWRPMHENNGTSSGGAAVRASSARRNSTARCTTAWSTSTTWTT
jgi:hypothetical protein